MTTTDPAAPWAQFGEPSGLWPGQLVAWRRMERAERAEEERRRAEAQDRADARMERAMWDAQQRAAMRGLAWDPAKPFEHEPSMAERSEALFAAQDAEDARAERKALVDAGLLTLLDGPGFYPSSQPSESGSVTSPAPAARASLVAKIRLALRRMPRRSIYDGHPSFRSGEWIPPDRYSPEERAARVREIVG
jgi:hypothetical protein